MTPKPRPDIDDDHKREIIQYISHAADTAVPQIRPYELIQTGTSKAAEPMLRILVDEKNEPVHIIRRQKDGAIRISTLGTAANDQPILGRKQQLLEPLRLAMRNLLREEAAKKFGQMAVAQTAECRRTGPDWVANINREADRLCSLAIGDAEKRRADTIVNRGKRRHLIREDTLKQAQRIVRLVSQHRSNNADDITYWQYNLAALAGDNLEAMLNDEENHAVAAYFHNFCAPAYWSILADCDQPTKAVRDHVAHRLQLDDDRMAVFGRVKTHSSHQDDPHEIIAACAALGTTVTPQTNQEALQHAYYMGIYHRLDQTKWQHDQPSQAWARTLAILMPDRRTTPAVITQVYWAFRDAVDHNEPWPERDWDQLHEIAQEGPAKPDQDTARERYSDPAILPYEIAQATIDGITLHAIRSAQNMREMESVLLVRLDHAWSTCRDQQTRAFCVTYDEHIRAVATIERSRPGWRPGKIIAGRERSAPPGTQEALQRLAVLYGAAERASIT